jgi:hypothetical protein
MNIATSYLKRFSLAVICIITSYHATYSLIQLPKKRIGPFDMHWYGFSYTDAFVNSRQVVNTDDDFPEAPVEDIYGQDVKARGQSDILPIYSRLGIKIDGPKVGPEEAHVYALLEADFFGRAEPDLFEPIEPSRLERNFRLRHAFLDMKWREYEFLVGQSWHPFAFPPLKPATIAIGYGIPIVSYNRSPQIRFTYYGKSYEVVAAVLSQLMFVSDGPLGLSPIYARNAFIQNAHLQYIFFPNEHTILGAGFDFKRLVPRLAGLVDNHIVKVQESINSIAALAYIDLDYECHHITSKIAYAQNGTNLNMIGGYAVHSIDPVTDQRTYTNLNTLAWWIDLYAKGTIQPGIFAGVSENFGASKTIIPSIEVDDVVIPLVYGVGSNINRVIKVAPRIQFNFEPFIFGIELGYTRVGYGTLTAQGTITDVKPVTNIRPLIAFYYIF